MPEWRDIVRVELDRILLTAILVFLVLKAAAVNAATNGAATIMVGGVFGALLRSIEGQRYGRPQVPANGEKKT